MNRVLALISAAGSLLLAACVTINVYFPAAAAQAAADRVIDEVWGGQAAPAPAAKPDAPAPTSALDLPEAREIAFHLLDFVLPAAQAADEPNLDVTSPEIQRLTDSMEARFPDLAPYYDSGAVGLMADGYIGVRDNNLVPLPERNKLRTLVANENADRTTLYRELAGANRQPQWESQIRAVFAKRWIERARRGWYVQVDGAWKQK